MQKALLLAIVSLVSVGIVQWAVGEAVPQKPTVLAEMTDESDSNYLRIKLFGPKGTGSKLGRVILTGGSGESDNFTNGTVDILLRNPKGNLTAYLYDGSCKNLGKAKVIGALKNGQLKQAYNGNMFPGNKTHSFVIRSGTVTAPVVSCGDIIL